MPEIRFMQTAWRVSAGFLSFARAGTGLLLMGMVLGYGIPGWAFDGFKKVPKSKPAVIHIRLEATAEKEIVRPGETFLIFVVVYLDEGWHMYSLEKQTEDETVATRILLDPPAFPPASEWRESKPVLARDEVLSKILKTHSGRV
ncbi:MAG: hypothetical protein GWN88_11070, partial [Nitrospinaceae bacterium]|nr:hypothetical protein [Nitrospinaceae bacterium]NIU44726.1 hypothetical protein [Nitrospinaceae bacterium]